MARAFVLILLVGTLMLGSASAATYSFGSIVAKTDWDYTPNPAGTTRLGLCYQDVNGDGAYSTGEPLYLDVSGYITGTTFCASGSLRTELGVDDIRIVPLVNSFAPGSAVAATDSDLGDFMSDVATHFLRYVDTDGDAKFKNKDVLYIDLSNLASKQVTPGDIRLTPTGPYAVATAVKAGDSDVNMPLTEISGAGVGFGSDNIVYKAGSGYYVNTDGQALATTTASTGYNRDYVVEENDVRINTKAENPLGDFNTPTFLVADATVVSEKVVAGKWLQLKVTMRNNGKAPGSALVETFVDDALVDSRGTATIAPGKDGSIVLSLPAPEDAGRAKLRVGKDTLVFYTVEPAQASAATGLAPATENAQPVAPLNAATQGAPGVPTLLLVGLVGALAWLRRR